MDVRKFAEELYRKEHSCELSDLRSQDQANYLSRVEAFIELWNESLHEH